MGMRLTLHAARVCAIALVVAGSTAAPASADLLLGLQDDALLTSPEPQAWTVAQQLGPKVVRFNVAWEQVAPTQPVNADDPADPAYNFANADLMAQKTAEIGAQSMFSIVNGTPWANGGREPRYMPSALEFGRFCGVVARRYSGTFTPVGATAPLPAVKKFTVWNEPNRGQYFFPQGRKGAVAAKNFATLVAACVPAIKAVSPDAVVAPGPLASRPDKRKDVGGSPPIEFLTMYKAAGGPKPQVLAYNPYMNGLLPQFKPKETTKDGAITLRNLDQLQGWLKRNYHRTTPLWFTEFAWRTAPTPRLGDVSPEQQASLTGRTIELVRQHYPYVQIFTWFLLRDQDQSGYWRSGLVTFDWQLKPAFQVFQAEATH